LYGASKRVVRRLEAKGCEAVGFDAGAGFYTRLADTPQGLAGNFSHKHAAYVCGLGSFGVNNLILTANYGPRIRFTSILTSAELPNARVPEVNLCRSPACDACVQRCPVRALDEWNDGYSASEGWRIAKRKCYTYIFDTLGGQRCGLCTKVCPVGLSGPHDR
jgi:epoxyqueuosine reductase QueG